MVRSQVFSVDIELGRDINCNKAHIIIYFSALSMIQN